MQYNESKVTQSYKFVVYVVCSVAALGGLLFGLDQGFIANSLPTIEKVYHLGLEGGEKYSAILATGGVLGALLSGIFARYLGRKKSLILSGFLFSLCSLISAFLPSMPILSTCRFFLGFAVGIASFIVPLYLSETAPASIRGSMGTLFQLLITIGIFLISLTNVIIASIFINPHVALPVMFCVIVVFALLMFFGALTLPESPRWLMLKGRKEQAIKALERTLSTKDEVVLEIQEIEEVLRKAKETSSFGEYFRAHFIKILIVGIVLQMFQQLVGINMMIYYAPTIFGYAGMKGYIAMMTVPVVNVIFTFPAIKLVEKIGRKKLLYLGSVVMLITMISAGAAFSIISQNPAGVEIHSAVKTMLLVSVIIYIFGFAVAWGPVAWLVCSEIFPIKNREVGMTITTMVNWTFAGLVMGNALTFMHTHGNASIFYLFGGFCVLSIIFVKFFVPETKGVTLEELELNLKAGLPLRKLGERQVSVLEKHIKDASAEAQIDAEDLEHKYNVLSTVLLTSTKTAEINKISIDGRIDTSSAQKIEQKLLSYIKVGRAYNLIVDMKTVDYISSSGLRVLVSLAKFIEANGGKLVLIVNTPAVLRSFEVSGLSQGFTIVSSEDLAIAAFYKK